MDKRFALKPYSYILYITKTVTVKKIQLNDTKPDRFHDREASILYPSCFDANAGLFEQICGPEVHFTIWGSLKQNQPQDVILSDELNHASIIDGIRLTKSRKYRL